MEPSLVGIQMSVEVERKFLCSADVLKTLEEIGVCVGQHQFHDEYFDTPEFHLTLRDMWLRKRKGCWELKYPAAKLGGSEESRDAALCTRYNETTDLLEIGLRVKEVVGGEDREACPSQEDQSWLGRWRLACFAEFRTVRRSYMLEEGVRVDLDRADFGYDVGEMEVLVPEGGDLQLAVEKIGRTAQKLGLSGDERIEGKMNVYLRRNHPEHYARLLREHVL